jgi:4-hydroxy-2-oxoheptanedioate aldolase
MERFSGLLDKHDWVIGTWSQFANPEVIDILGSSGFRFTIVDAEHGHFGMETAENLVRACDAAGLVPMVRVPANETHLITKALDLGAVAVVVPKIASAEEAERAVRAARYGPQGTRGACPCIRAGGHLVGDWRAFAASENSPRIVALVETPEAIDAVRDIASVPGLLAILVGPFDLSVAMGLDGDTVHARVQAAIEGVIEAVASTNLQLVMPLFQPDVEGCRQQIDRWRRRGVRVFTIGTDKLLLADHCRRYVAALR